MSVTPRADGVSRNGSPLAELIVAMEPGWFCARWGGARSCESRNGDPHCPVCHLPVHRCHQCGDEIYRYGSSAITTRSDRAYCSNACRQRAYRQRDHSKGA